MDLRTSFNDSYLLVDMTCELTSLPCPSLFGQVVAKLTADNLMFLMNLKKAEADLTAANQDRAQLRLAVEKQRGPWFDEVRCS